MILKKDYGSWIGGVVFGIGFFLLMIFTNSGIFSPDYFFAVILGFSLSVCVGAEIGRIVWKKFRHSH